MYTDLQSALEEQIGVYTRIERMAAALGTTGCVGDRLGFDGDRCIYTYRAGGDCDWGWSNARGSGQDDAQIGVYTPIVESGGNWEGGRAVAGVDERT